MPFSTFFSVASQRLVLLSMLSWLTVLCTIFLLSHWPLSHITIFKTVDTGERNEFCCNDLSILRKNIGQAGNQTRGTLFSSSVCYQLSYRAQLILHFQHCQREKLLLLFLLLLLFFFSIKI